MATDSTLAVTAPQSTGERARVRSRYYLWVSAAAHDLMTRRRVHGATVWGAAFAVLCTIASGAISQSELGLALVRALQ
jgi:hypothetical protein